MKNNMKPAQNNQIRFNNDENVYIKCIYNPKIIQTIQQTPKSNQNNIKSYIMIEKESSFGGTSLINTLFPAAYLINIRLKNFCLGRHI